MLPVFRSQFESAGRFSNTARADWSLDAFHRASSFSIAARIPLDREHVPGRPGGAFVERSNRPACTLSQIARRGFQKRQTALSHGRIAFLGSGQQGTQFREL